MSDSEFELFIHEQLDRLVDDLVERMNKEARKELDDPTFEVSGWDKSQAKYFLKEMIPSQSPTTAFIVSQVLRAMLHWAHDQRAIEAATESPEKIEEMINNIVESETGQGVLKKLEEKQKVNANKYKALKKGDKTMQVADLGDLMSNASLN